MKNQEKPNNKMKNMPSSELQEASSHELTPEALEDLRVACEEPDSCRSKKDPKSTFEEQYEYYKEYKEAFEVLKLRNEIKLVSKVTSFALANTLEALKKAIRDATNNAEANGLNNFRMLLRCQSPFREQTTDEAAKKQAAKENIFSRYEEDYKIFISKFITVKRIKLDEVLKDCTESEEPKQKFACQLLIREILQDFEAMEEYKASQELMNLKTQDNSKNKAAANLERKILLRDQLGQYTQGKMSTEYTKKDVCYEEFKKKYTLIDDDLAESLEARYQEEKSKVEQGAEKVFNDDKEKDGFVMVEQAVGSMGR